VTLRRLLTVEDFRRAARRRLPRSVFDFVEGGAGDEVTLGRNRTAFDGLAFQPRILVDVAKRDQSTTVLGERVETPVLIAPTGIAGVCWRRGEIQAARAARQAGTIYTLSTHASCSIEDVARAAPGPLWFQLYVWQNRELTRGFVERAKAAGYRALLLTVDVPLVSTRERDVRNGFVVPPRFTLRNCLDTLRRPRWMANVLLGPRLTLANLVTASGAGGAGLVTLGRLAQRQFDPSVTWGDLRWFRSLWPGPLVLKGVLTVADARLAIEHGVDGIVVSNHGGRQLDGAPASLEVLPEIVDAVGGRAEVLLDGGIRRGADVVKALALGARAVMIGRPHLYGLAVGGEAGVGRVLDLIRGEIDKTLGLLGVPRIADLDRSALRGVKKSASG
jgi:isopentenyl diphosphate isomerase/L-lactate dehydrogenase-like FMN-dependent dehydrogenase